MYVVGRITAFGLRPKLDTSGAESLCAGCAAVEKVCAIHVEIFVVTHAVMTVCSAGTGHVEVWILGSLGRLQHKVLHSLGVLEAEFVGRMPLSSFGVLKVMP